jgi:hypothetical protein
MWNFVKFNHKSKLSFHLETGTDLPAAPHKGLCGAQKSYLHASTAFA